MTPRVKPKREFISNNRFVKITINGHSTYFCRRCHSQKELAEPQCSCQIKEILGWAIIIVCIFVPMLAVTIKLINGML